MTGSARPDDPDRFRSVVHVNAILRDGDRVMLTRRARGLAGGGYWQLPGGHLEAGESLLAAVARETAEEVGVTVPPEGFAFSYLMHYRNLAGASRVSVFFEAPRWSGTPVNLEPDRCDELGFFALDDLPRKVLPHVAAALRGSRKGDAFGTLGWAR